MAYTTNQFSNLLNSFNTTFEQKREIVSVNGVQEAKNFYLNRGENIILRDSNEDVIYVKICDDGGKCSLKVYSCTDITEQALSSSTSAGVSRSDFEALAKELKELKEILKNEHNVSKPKSRNESARSDSAVQE